MRVFPRSGSRLKTTRFHLSTLLCSSRSQYIFCLVAYLFVCLSHLSWTEQSVCATTTPNPNHSHTTIIPTHTTPHQPNTNPATTLHPSPFTRRNQPNHFILSKCKHADTHSVTSQDWLYQRVPQKISNQYSRQWARLDLYPGASTCSKGLFIHWYNRKMVTYLFTNLYSV